MVRLIVPNANDAARLSAIERAAFSGRESPWSAEDYIAIYPPHGAVIADDHLMRGLLVLQFAADEAEIINLGTVPSVRRCGLARELMTVGEALAFELGCRRMVLEVAVDNTPARTLYTSLSYAEVGQRKGYYLRPDGIRMDALILAKDLPPHADP